MPIGKGPDRRPLDPARDYNDLAANAGLVRYEHDFYSGAQVQVMIGEVLIDNAVSVEYQVQQSKSPVYGYGSQYFRFIADGPVLISGSLTTAFKESGYLAHTLRHFHNTQGGRIRFGGSGWTKNTDPDGVWPYDPDWVPVGLGGPGRQLTQATEFESLIAAARAGGGRDQHTRYRNIEQIMDGTGPDYARLVKQLHYLSDQDFENAAEVFEDVLWYGAARTNVETRSQLYSNNIPEDHPHLEIHDILAHRRVDQYPPCDIWITYGDMEAPDGVNHTVYKLLDVHFTGESQVIGPSGEPVHETYTFLARNRV